MSGQLKRQINSVSFDVKNLHNNSYKRMAEYLALKNQVRKTVVFIYSFAKKIYKCRFGSKVIRINLLYFKIFIFRDDIYLLWYRCSIERKKPPTKSDSYNGSPTLLPLFPKKLPWIPLESKLYIYFCWYTCTSTVDMRAHLQLVYVHTYSWYTCISTVDIRAHLQLIYVHT